MSNNNEILEAPATCQPAEGNALINCLNDARNNMSAKDYGNLLSAKGDTGAGLPQVALFEAKGDVPPPPPQFKNEGTSDKDLAADGVKRQHGQDSSKTEFPNGVKVATGGKGADVQMDNGKTLHISGAMTIEAPKGAHEGKKGSGMVVDKEGHPLYQSNKDGSKTVFTEKGAYTVRNDGTVTKESMYYNRETGRFDPNPTDVPLGATRPSDMGSVNKPANIKRH